MFTKPRVHFYRPMACFEVSGDDAFSFLQGQFTNQLQHPVGSATYGLWLNQKGKVLADSILLRTQANEFRLLSEWSLATEIQARLEAYIIADDVVLKDVTAESAGIALVGDGCGEVLRTLVGAVPVAGQFVSAAAGVGENGVCAFVGRRGAGENFEIVGAQAAIAALTDEIRRAGIEEVNADELGALRIRARIAAVPRDIGATELPSEGGLDESAISYTKGCYLGQEVMARLKNLGQVRRQLHVVAGRGAAPASRMALYQGVEKVGEVHSAAPEEDGFVALAMLSLIKFKPSVALSSSPGGEPSIEVIPHG